MWDVCFNTGIIFSVLVQCINVLGMSEQNYFIVLLIIQNKKALNKPLTLSYFS